PLQLVLLRQLLLELVELRLELVGLVDLRLVDLRLVGLRLVLEQQPVLDHRLLRQGGLRLLSPRAPRRPQGRGAAPSSTAPLRAHRHAPGGGPSVAACLVVCARCCGAPGGSWSRSASPSPCGWCSASSGRYRLRRSRSSSRPVTCPQAPRSPRPTCGSSGCPRLRAPV